MSACPSGDQRLVWTDCHDGNAGFGIFSSLFWRRFGSGGVVTNRDRHFFIYEVKDYAVRLNYKLHAAEGTSAVFFNGVKKS